MLGIPSLSLYDGRRFAISSLGVADAFSSNNLHLIKGDYAPLSLLPEIEVAGNGSVIADGDSSPSPSDDTSFDSLDVASGAVIKTFSIRNTGTAALILGSNAVSINGANASEFSVIKQPDATLAAGNSTEFDIEFNPAEAGIRSVTIEISNDDSDEAPFTFLVQGSGTSASGGSPEMEVFGNSTGIASGHSLPSLTNHTDFGGQNVRSGDNFPDLYNRKQWQWQSKPWSECCYYQRSKRS